MSTRASDPHAGQAVRTAGVPLDAARSAMIMIHGRGATAESILTLAPLLGVEDCAFLAPQAAGGAWYPYGFMSPIEGNEPGISSGMRVIESLLRRIETAGLPASRVVLLGFSQGACLVTEFAARHATRYGGIAGLSGGLIGPEGTPRKYEGSLTGTPVFLGCSDVDFHIPAQRVRETATVLEQLGGQVTMRLYGGMGHTVNDDEIEQVREMLSTVGVS